MSWNLDHQGSFGYNREKAAQLFLKRGIGVIHEAAGIELSVTEFGIGTLDILKKIRLRWYNLSVVTTHPDSTINYLITIGVSRWVQNLKRHPDKHVKREETLDLAKIHKSFEDIASVVQRLFPTFPVDSMHRIEESSRMICSLIENESGLWTKDFRNKAATLLTLHPLVYHWGNQDSELKPVLGAFQDIFPGSLAK